MQGESRSSCDTGLSRCILHGGRGEQEAIPTLTGSCLTQQGFCGSPRGGGEESPGGAGGRVC